MVDNGIIQKNVAYVVQTALNQMLGKVNDVAWFEQLAIQWLSEDAAGVTSLPSLRVKRLPVSAAKQVQLPYDCLRYTKIAIDYGGKLWTLTLNNDITVPPSMSCNSNSTVESGTPVSDGVFFIDHYWDGSYYGGLFAMGGGFNHAYYRYDEETRVLSFLDNVLGREIVIEYLSNGADINPDSLVPHYYIAPLRNWLKYQAAFMRPNEYRFDPRVLRIEYDQSMMDAAIGTGPTIDEIMDAYYSAPGLTIR